MSIDKTLIRPPSGPTIHDLINEVALLLEALLKRPYSQLALILRFFLFNKPKALKILIELSIHYYALYHSAWEYQSATLDCNYHTARQSSAAQPPARRFVTD